MTTEKSDNNDAAFIAIALAEARTKAHCGKKCVTDWNEENGYLTFSHEVSGLKDTHAVPKEIVTGVLPIELAYWLAQRHETQKETRRANARRRASLVP